MSIGLHNCDPLDPGDRSGRVMNSGLHLKKTNNPVNQARDTVNIPRMSIEHKAGSGSHFWHGPACPACRASSDIIMCSPGSHTSPWQTKTTCFPTEETQGWAGDQRPHHCVPQLTTMSSPIPETHCPRETARRKDSLFLLTVSEAPLKLP